MSAINQEFIDLLLQRCDIETVVSRYVVLKRAGSSLVGLCPFHGEKTPSFHVTKEKGLYYCFGCHAGGNAINFVSKIENIDNFEAIEKLASSVGMEIPHDNKIDNKQYELRKTIYKINTEAATFFHNTLLTDLGKNARQYLRERQLYKNTIIKFGIGYAPSSWDSLIKHLTEKGYYKKDIIAAGLANENANGRAFDRFRDRIMFPIIDYKGNVIGFGGRTMTNDPAKYLNTSDTLAFSKGNNLFALNFAKTNAEKGLILCEGYMDVISLHQAGIENAVASLGTALTPNQAKLIKKFTSNVFLCYDNDNAGKNATKKNIDVLSAEDIRVKIINIPSGKDPDEYVKQYGADGFRKLLVDGIGKIDYKINEMRQRFNIEIDEQKIDFLKAIVPVLAGISNNMELEIYIKKIAEQTDTSVASISSEISKYKKNLSKTNKKQEKRKTYDEIISPTVKLSQQYVNGSAQFTAEESIIKVMINYTEYIETAKDILAPDDFISEFCSKIYTSLLNHYPFDTQEPINILLNELDSDSSSKIVSMVMNADGILTNKNIFIELCNKIKNSKSNILKSKLKDISDEEMDTLLKEIQQKNKKEE